MATATTPGNYDKSKALLNTSVAVFAILAVIAAAGWWFIRKPHFNGTQPVSISVLLHAPRSVNATSPSVELLNATITSEQGCSNVLAVLNVGRLRRDHTCAPVGTLNIKFANGKSNEVHLLPTHRSEDAEFRVGVLKYKVAREKLYPALTAAGIDVSKIPAAGH
ncbi:MAG: hypothetical protein ACREXY_29050, partial [Gammaproteobacteria bacterium]